MPPPAREQTDGRSCKPRRCPPLFRKKRQTLCRGLSQTAAFIFSFARQNARGSTALSVPSSLEASAYDVAAHRTVFSLQEETPFKALSILLISAARPDVRQISQPVSLPNLSRQGLLRLPFRKPPFREKAAGAPPPAKLSAPLSAAWDCGQLIVMSTSAFEPDTRPPSNKLRLFSVSAKDAGAKSCPCAFPARNTAVYDSLRAPRALLS